MEVLKEIKLDSGAVLKISPTPFKESKALYQAILEELKGVTLDPDAGIDVNLFKDMFCIGFSSPKIEKALYECMKRCSYNDVRLAKVEEVFESMEARPDYIPVCIEVTKENILPFGKSLYAQFAPIMELLMKQKGPA